MAKPAKVDPGDHAFDPDSLMEVLGTEGLTEEPFSDDWPSPKAGSPEWFFAYARRTPLSIVGVHRKLADGSCTCPDPHCKQPGQHVLLDPVSNRMVVGGRDDYDQLARYLKETPDLNLGLVAGAASGILVLTVDIQHGGRDTLAELVEKHGPLPDTRRATLEGVYEYYLLKFDARVDRTLLNFAGGGLHVVSGGNYVLVEPSIDEYGNRARWVTPW